MGIFVSISLIFLLGNPGAAHAGRSALDEACPAPAEFEARILRCGQNEDVAAQAAFCAQEVADSWAAATALILPELRALGKNGNQSVTEADSKHAYKKALHSIEAQVELMQFYTARLEKYPLAMIDVPGSSGDESSLDCFNEAFHSVQKQIDFLDDEIIQAKKTYETTADMMDLSGSRQVAMADSLSRELSRGASRAPVPSGVSSRTESTVTGKIEKAKLSSVVSRAPKAKEQFAGSKITASMPGATQDASLAASFSDRLDEQAVAKGLDRQASVAGSKTGASLGGSIGSVIWKNDSEVVGSGKALDLALSERQAFTGEPGAEAVRFPAGSSDQSEAEPKLVSGVKAFSMETEPVKPSRFSIGGRETDLFALVKSRYRETELFRHAR